MSQPPELPPRGESSSPKNHSLDHLLHEGRHFPPRAQLAAKAHIANIKDYEALYKRSIEDSDNFWLEQAQNLDWFHHPKQACQYQWDSKNDHIEHSWFADGKLNVSVNCLDRHLASRGKKTAILWQGDADSEVEAISYEELHRRVCRCALALKALGIQKGDRVCIYLPMIPELAVAMLACARIGAIHSIVFGGFSAQSLKARINDSTCKLLITCDHATRGGKGIDFKKIADQALQDTPSIEKALVVRRSKNPCTMQAGRDLCFHSECGRFESFCEAEILDAEDPLFILYTSGSTGKPKGVVHTQAGYLLHASLSHKLIFDIHDKDIYWCTADIGWITGHSYVIYGPLANGATTVMFEGTPTWPQPNRFWQVVEKHKVSVFYTAPTAIRTLMGHGTQWVKQHDISSLRILGTVGEPINPEAWIWYHSHVGESRCPVVDTWWQTETGGIMITPIPGAHTLKPGSASRPFLGVDPVILQTDGSPCKNDEGGHLCIRRPWPGIMRTTWGDHQRFIDTYFSQHPGLYFSADGARVDNDGDYWLMGRIDDVVNVSGHNIGTAEVESALVSHEAVAEAAIVPMPHPVKGQALYAFITLMDNVEKIPGPLLRQKLKDHVKHAIGAIATPEEIQFAPSLPKTRSGKIMRRVLRKIVEKRSDQLGDISTLADPSVVDSLVSNCQI